MLRLLPCIPRAGFNGLKLKLDYLRYQEKANFSTDRA
jgi:hypothetical protein